MKLHLVLVFLLFRFSANAQMQDSVTITIRFAFNQFQLSDAARHSIDSFFYQFDTAHFTIKEFALAGHTDQIGSHPYNDRLSIQRATAVAEYLGTKKFDSAYIIKNMGYGKHILLTEKMDEGERQLNRRVEITCYFSKKIPPVQKEILPPPVTLGKDTSKPAKIIKITDRIKDTAVRIGDTIELPFILFIGGRHEFLQFSYPYLDELLEAMKNNPNLEIEIQGHICCAPGKEDGLDLGTGKNNLSVARARAVYDYLHINGIDKRRMNYKGFGHRFPITLERNEAEKTRNRRVEIKITKK